MDSFFGPGELPGEVVFLEMASEPRHQARWLAWSGMVGAGSQMHQFLSLDDPRCRAGLCRVLARAAARVCDPADGSSGWLATMALRMAVRKNGLRLSRARRDHRRMAGRVQKLLAFTGRTGN